MLSLLYVSDFPPASDKSPKNHKTCALPAYFRGLNTDLGMKGRKNVERYNMLYEKIYLPHVSRQKTMLEKT